MSSPGEDEQSRADVRPSLAAASQGGPEHGLEWQSELDSALTDIDTRLRHPRRRASDVAAQPTLPQLGQIDVTNELLDEIAWRVSEQMKRTQGATLTVTPSSSALPPAAPLPAKPEMPAGTAIVIRLRRPLFSWKFWRRRSRRRQMINFSDLRVT